MKALLSRGDFRLLFAGQGISALGDWMVTVALIALVRKISDSSTAIGGVLVLRLVPGVLAGPLAARAAERWDRRRTMMAMDLVRAGMVVAIPFVNALWWVYVWAFLLEVTGIVFLPARDASIPDLVEHEQLELANGLILGSSYGTIPLGAGAFAAVAALTPHHVGFLRGHPLAIVFWIDSATFLVSFAFVRRLTELGSTAAQRETATAPEHGFRAAFHIPLVRTVAGPTACIALGLGTLFSIGIVFVRDVLHATDAQFGVLIALFGAGAAVGLGLLQAYRWDGLIAVQMGVATQGATIAVMSLSPNIAICFIGAAAFGAATAWTLAAGMSVLQEDLEGEQRVLAFTAFHVLIRGGLSLAAIGAGVAADLVGAVRWPGFGRLEPSRLVLFCAGALVFFSSSLVRRQPPAARRGAVRPDPEGSSGA